MEILHRRGKLWDILLVIAGTFLLAAGVNLVYDPMGMVTGGVSGLAIIVKEVTANMTGGEGGPIWLSNILINVPIFLLAWILVGKSFVVKTLFGTLSLSAALYIVPYYDLCGGDYLLATVFGAVFTGGGIGLVLMASASTGGTDMLSVALRRFLRHYTVPQILMVIDGAVVVLGAGIFGIRSALYAVIAVYIATKVGDAILDGIKFAKMVYIISDKYEAIADDIMNKMDRGVTGVFSQGMYTKAEKNMLLCVVGNKEIARLKELVRTQDPRAFMIVSDVREAMGEGFIEYSQDDEKKQSFFS